MQVRDLLLDVRDQVPLAQCVESPKIFGVVENFEVVGGIGFFDVTMFGYLEVYDNAIPKKHRTSRTIPSS